MGGREVSRLSAQVTQFVASAFRSWNRANQPLLCDVFLRSISCASSVSDVNTARERCGFTRVGGVLGSFSYRANTSSASENDILVEAMISEHESKIHNVRLGSSGTSRHLRCV